MPVEQRKSLDEMVLRIRVNSAQGDKVRVNLPMTLVKMALELGVDIVPNHADGMDSLHNIDLAKITELVERGLMGKLVEVESANGDIVEVVVE